MSHPDVSDRRMTCASLYQAQCTPGVPVPSSQTTPSLNCGTQVWWMHTPPVAEELSSKDRSSADAVGPPVADSMYAMLYPYPCCTSPVSGGTAPTTPVPSLWMTVFQSCANMRRIDDVVVT